MDDVPLAAGARHRQQVVMKHEDAEEGLALTEVLLDPLVAATADQPVVEVRLGGVDREDRNAVHVKLGPALTEQLLEVHIPDVAGVVVARDHDHLPAIDLVQVLARQLVLRAKAVAGEVSDTTTTSGSRSLTSTIVRSSRL